LQRYPWPGNVRELRNVVERLLLLADGPVDLAAVRLALPASDSEFQGNATAFTGTLTQRTDVFEREQILAELKRHNQRMTDTAKALGLERSHLYKSARRWGSTCGRCERAPVAESSAPFDPGRQELESTTRQRELSDLEAFRQCDKTVELNCRGTRLSSSVR